MAKSPTVEDVARVAGVSRQTVSNVLNTPAIVKGSTRERVESAIAQLGYRPHAAARML
ncbi:MAG: LacI family DNA-binding transcriptional regulator, partial [Naasia sp.]